MPQSKLSSQEYDLLLHAAREAMQSAYAPYSNFKVGAAILTAQDQVFSGCNVENASFGLTNCAERSAIFTAIAASKTGKLDVRAVVVVNANDVPCSPCGACRQVISEFAADANTIVIFRGKTGYEETTIGNLLPESFRLS